MFQFGGLSFDLAHQSMALYAAEVMPKLRDLNRPGGAARR
jgi:hypothetical protein